MEKSISLKDKRPPASTGESSEFTLSKRAYSNLNLKLTLKTLIKALINDKLSSTSKHSCLKYKSAFDLQRDNLPSSSHRKDWLEIGQTPVR